MTSMVRVRHTFPKAEKLCGKKDIEELFQHGSSFYLHPFVVKFLDKTEVLTANRILISVPKKKFKRAVDRNLIKRRVREAYRLNKHQIFHEQTAFYHVAIIYLDKEIKNFDHIQERLVKLLMRLKKHTTSSDAKKD